MTTPSASARSASRLQIWGGMLVLYLVWGSTYLAIRFAVETLPPFLMAALRFLAAGSILLVWRLLAGDPLPRPRDWRVPALVGLFLLLGGNGGVSWAEQRVPSGIAALLVGCTPLWMALLNALRLRRLPPWPTLAGLLIGFGGIFLLVGPGEMAGGGAVDPLGALVISLAALSWAAGSIYSQAAQHKGGAAISPALNSALQMLAGGAALLLVGTAGGEWARLIPHQVSGRSLLAVAYLIGMGSLVGFTAYGWLLKHAPLTLVSTYAYVNPLVAVFLGSLLAAEPLTPRVLLAATVIVGSVALITLKKETRS